MQDTNQQEVLSILAQDLLKEKRSERRWRNIRFIAWFLLIALVAFNIFSLINKSSGPTPAENGKYTSLIRLNGMIAPENDFSGENIVPILKEAFSDKRSEGVIIDINSPGGTPVQAAIIHDAIIAYKKKYHKKVIAVGEDMLTSGAYYVAVAADKIYVNANTLTGSIGVVMKGFGFVDLIKKLGVERRVFVAGDQKDRLDPFLPQTAEDMKKIHEVMKEVHENFANAVLAGRKGKLRADAKTLFTGDFWSGQQAVNLGLVDGIGNLMDVSSKEFGTTRYREFGRSPNLFRMLGGQLNSALDMMFYMSAV